MTKLEDMKKRKPKMVQIQIRVPEELKDRCDRLQKKLKIATFSKFGALVFEWACENSEGKK